MKRGAGLFCLGEFWLLLLLSAGSFVWGVWGLVSPDIRHPKICP